MEWLGGITKARSRGTAAEAARLGLTFNETDPRLKDDLDMELLDRRSGAISNVMEGTWNGAEVAAFDFHHGEDVAQTLSCALVELHHEAPRMLVTRLGLVARLLDAIRRDRVTLGDAEFDAVYFVRTNSPSGARAWIGPRLRRWLIDEAPADATFELASTDLMCCRPQRAPDAIEDLLRLARGFADRVSDGAAWRLESPAAGATAPTLFPRTPEWSLFGWLALTAALWILAGLAFLAALLNGALRGPSATGSVILAAACLVAVGVAFLAAAAGRMASRDLLGPRPHVTTGVRLITLALVVLGAFWLVTTPG